MVKALKIVAMSMILGLCASWSMGLAEDTANNPHEFCGFVVGEDRM